jgi:Asp-tRNA(Asn)/Glu-tRNA(Gln) amidotransferase A subunit family amidase
MADYQKDSIKAPKLAGWKLRTMVKTLEGSTLGPSLIRKICNDSGIARWREVSAGHASPIQLPLPHPAPPRDVLANETWAAQACELPSAPAALATTRDFAQAFRNDPRMPMQIAERAISAIAKMDTGADRMGWFITHRPEDVRRAAEASVERFRKGRPLSVLDGVPVVIKDEVDVAGYPTTLGTKFRNDNATADATLIARLKSAGAVILGKANMNEIGINPIGLNPHHGAARNPWNRSHITGGSSSASAATVAAGLCPISIGADGGGSIRIPAGLCGVVGLKATFGRIPETGIPPLCWNVGHAGPIGLTVADVAAAYAIIAGACPGDAVSQAQPAHHLASFGDDNMQGIRIGICWPYFEDADQDVVARCKVAVQSLVERGAIVVEIPPPDLNTIKWSHAVIILSEMAAAMRIEVLEDSSRFALDSRTNLAIARTLTATDLVHAMRHRHRLTVELLATMRDVDMIITPTTATTAPPIPEYALPDGESNLPVVDSLMRFIRIGNLTGFPGLAVPCGVDRQGLPVSVHLMARPYEEALLLRAGRIVERLRATEVPKHYVNLLMG